MQINVANSNIVKSEDTIINTGVENDTPVKSGGKIQGEKIAIYKSGSKDNKSITYSKNDLMEEEQNKVKDQVNITSLVDSLNTMITPEGYNEMEELGIVPDDENPELSMSVYERIQMELATYCEDYVPTGLNIDEKKLKELLGSTAFANAVDKAMSIRKLDEKTEAAIVKDENIGNLQIDKIYEKVYSSKSAIDKKTEISDKVWDELKPQVEKILFKAGLENTEEIEDISKWLVSNDIPVTKENIDKAAALHNITKLDDEQYKNIVEKNIAYTLYFTGNTQGATIEKSQYELDDVNEAIESISNITNGQLEKLVEDNRELNLLNIKKYSKEYIGKEGKENNTKVLSARKVVIEATLIMTVPSLMRVKQLGININITNLTTLLDKINEMESKEAEKYLESVNANVTQSNISSFISTNKAMIAIKQSDISFVAKVEKTDNLERVAKIAISSYEESATNVRSDLGDSYEKAFSNIDHMLDELGMDVNEENKRAVKILGYNAMSINKANIDRVREMAEQIDNLADNLNPKTAAYLIANDINPMKKNILELNEELKNINEEIGTTEENFAQFLWKLEKSNNISKEDRQKYINLFRNIKSITRKDIQALGAVINSNMEFTMDSLITAVKSRRVTGEIYKWKDEESFEEYKINMQKENVVTDEQVNQLINNHIAVTPRNIKNTHKLQHEKDVFKKFYNSSSESVKDMIDNILDADSQEELKEEFERICNESGKSVKEEMHREFPLYSDIETALENSGLARIVNEYAKNDSYYIPVKIGESITNIHLTLKSGEKESKALVDIKDSSLGQLHLEIYENDQVLKGMIVYENKASIYEVNEMAAAFREALVANNLQVGSITVVNSSTYTDTGSPVNKEDTKQNTKKLYNVAKLFITTVRSYEMETVGR